MNWFRLTCLLWGVLVTGLVAETPGFTHETWTNSAGKKIEAQLIKLDGNEVTLKLKKTGKRYTLKREKLSTESNGKIDKYRKDIQSKINKGKLGSDTLLKGAQLGLSKSLSAALKEQTVSFKVTNVRISTDKKEAHIEFGSGVYYQVHARRGYEFFERQDNLYQRPVNKRRIDGGTNFNELARLVARHGATFTIEFSDDPIVSEGTVGITDGVIIHR